MRTRFAEVLFGGPVMKYRLFTVSILATLASTLLFQNCANKNFGAGGTASINGSPSDPNPNPNPNPTPIDPTKQAIKMTLATPECQQYSTCEATFTLKQAQSIEIRFHWKTDDTRYQQDPTRIAAPNVNYVPTEGDLIFVPGQTTKLIYIQSLAISSALKIPFRWNSCTGNGQPIVCPEVEYLNPQ